MLPALRLHSRLMFTFQPVLLCQPMRSHWEGLWTEDLGLRTECLLQEPRAARVDETNKAEDPLQVARTEDLGPRTVCSLQEPKANKKGSARIGDYN